MKKPVVDYREFRFSRINEPRFSHVKLLAGWIFYFTMYFITENLIPASRCHPMHCRLDDLIPFNEYFLIFYVGWYFLVFGALLYTFLYKIENFRRLQIYLIVTQVVAMTCYVLWPSRQDLRPDVFVRDNALTHLIQIVRYAYRRNRRLTSLLTGYTRRFTLYCGQVQRTLTDGQRAVMQRIAEYVINDGAISAMELNDIDTDLWRSGVVALGGVPRLEEEMQAMAGILLKAS